MSTVSTASAAKLLGVTQEDLRRKLCDAGLTHCGETVPLSWLDRQLAKQTTPRKSK